MRSGLLITLLGAACVGFPGICGAQNALAGASPSPTPTPKGIVWSVDGSNTFVSQHTGGPGTEPPEGAGFAAGAPLSPMTPYDTFSGAPLTPGNAGALQYVGTATLTGKALQASLRFGAGLVTGSTTNLAYWGENLLPGLNPHLGSTVLPYRIVLPQASGQDDASAVGVSLLGGTLGTADGSTTLRAGYFHLNQTAEFIFTHPPLTNVTPAIGVATAETLGDGSPALDWWPAAPIGSPLLGVDFTSRRGSGTFELSDAQLPALPGTAARIVNGSYFVDRGGGTRYAFQVLNATTSGNAIATTTMFGADAQTIDGPKGELPVSTLGTQRQTIVGGAARFHLSPRYSGAIDLARAWYDAQNTIEPGSQKPGDYARLGLSEHAGRSTTGIELFEFSPRYASEILPYGAPENIWSVAWSWPGVWLKSNYQLVDNTALGSNRKGFRLRYALSPGTGPFALRVSYARYWQIDPATLANVNQTGFVEGFFLPQQNDAGTLGGSQQYALWASLTHSWGTFTLDYVNDLQYRPAVASHPEDYVSYVAPEAVVTFSHQLTPSALVSIGAGRYAMRGQWATTPVDYGQNVAFAGLELQESPHAGLLVQLRSSSFAGVPSEPTSLLSPDFGGTLVIVEERLHI
jgi:hypothetical protein